MPGQAYCRSCHAINMRESRQRRKALLAAAPDLLAACKLALTAFEGNCAIDWAVLENAIAKAERVIGER